MCVWVDICVRVCPCECVRGIVKRESRAYLSPIETMSFARNKAVLQPRDYVPFQYTIETSIMSSGEWNLRTCVYVLCMCLYVCV